MKNLIEYKNYLGSIEFSEEDKIFFGKVQGIKDLISYEGSNAVELINDFHAAVDDYLELCKSEGRKPEQAYKGSFNVRVSSKIHKQAVIYTIEHGMSLNSFVEQSMAHELAVRS